MKITGFYVRNGKLAKVTDITRYAGVIVGGTLTLKSAMEVANYLWLISLAFDPANPVSIAFRANPELLKPILESPAFQDMISNPDLRNQVLDLVKTTFLR